MLGSSPIFNNVVYFTTYVPDASVDTCGVALGSGYLYALSAFDGQPAHDFDDDGTIEDYDASSHDMRYALRHKGIPTSPSILIAENQNPEMFVGTEKIPSSIYNTTKRTYWLDSGID